MKQDWPTIIVDLAGEEELFTMNYFFLERGLLALGRGVPLGKGW